MLLKSPILFCYLLTHILALKWYCNQHSLKYLLIIVQETFEFLNILQVHGFPKVLGILTHLDQFKQKKALTKTKKRLKQRFWTEIYQGAKLFYLSGLMHGRYPKREVLNLARFISVQKFRPLVWRNSHPYILADRVEDITDPEKIRVNHKTDRRVCFYGYVHGTNFRPNVKVHIPGCGDFRIDSLSALPDPCPRPEKRKSGSIVWRWQFSSNLTTLGPKQKLNEKEKLLYAPMSDMGNIEFDRDAIYIKLPTNQIAFSDIDGLETTQNGPGEKMVRDLQSTSTTLDEKLAQSELRLFADSAPIQSSDVEQQGSRVRRPAEFRGGESTDDKKKLAFAEGLSDDEDNSEDEENLEGEDDDGDDGDDFDEDDDMDDEEDLEGDDEIGQYHIEDSDEEQENGDEDENMEDVDEDDEDDEAIDYNNKNFKATAGDDSDGDNDEDLVQEQSDEDDFPIPKADDDEYADDDDDEVDDDENDEDDDGDDEDDEMDEDDVEEDDEDNDEESEEDIGKNYDFRR